MFTRLRIKNFKAWKDSGAIRLAPLTVFFGTNSAGKSSIGQLLLLLKQTADSPDRQRVLHLGDSRTAVDLGTYSDIVYGHDASNPLGFEISWSSASKLAWMDPVSQDKYAGDALTLRVGIDATSLGQPLVQKIEYELCHGSNVTCTVALHRESGGTSSKFKLEADKFNAIRQKGRAWPLPHPVRCYGFPDEAIAYYQNTGFLADFALSFETQLHQLYYVGPLREYAKRLYLWSGETPEHVGQRGERTVEAILAGHGREFNFAAKSRKETMQPLIARWLKQMGLIHSFQIKPLSEGRKEYEVVVQVRERSTPVKLTDVGFGISQVLPILTECFYVKPGSTILVEQPELHLHPRVQSELADLFVDAIHAREGSKPRGIQLIVESHSEHFLRRLQRLIAEEKITPAAAALYFVDTEGPEAKIRELKVDEFGNIQNWPTNFFGDEMADIVARAEAQARRSTKRRSS